MAAMKFGPGERHVSAPIHVYRVHFEFGECLTVPAKNKTLAKAAATAHSKPTWGRIIKTE